MKQKRTVWRLKITPWNNVLSTVNKQKKQPVLVRLSLWIIICGCTSQSLLAQPGRNRNRSTNADSMRMNNAVDSIGRKEVKLVYYNVPSHLTAASTDVVYNKDLIKAPVTNVLNALTGRLSGVYTDQPSGQPGSDGVNFTLHGRSPLVLIDGVARNLTTLDLEEIESVTVLKDAVSTAMLGVRGANGAIQITTRKGNANKRSISFTAQKAIQQPLNLPQTLGAYDYALLRNEAVANELRVRPDLTTALARFKYSDADLQAYKNGTDTFGHPNIDWRNQILRKTSSLDRYSLNASGGNNFARFFVALEYLSQEGLFKESDLNKYTTNSQFKSYLARTNIDLNITPKLSAGIALLGRIINGTEPGGGSVNIFNQFLTTPNNAYPIYNRNSSFGGNQDYLATNLQNTALSQAGNIQGLTTGSGYLQSYRRDILVDFNLKRTLDELLPGLWIKARGAYSSNLTENINRTRVFVAYKSDGTNYNAVAGNTAFDQINTNGIGTQGRSTYIEGSAGYTHTFMGKHSLDVLLMANQDRMTTGSDLDYTISGTSGKVSYNFKEKYVLEAVYGLNGSSRYPGGKTKLGFFPAVGAAWNITNESFAKNIGFVSFLKLYASYGKAGNDNPGYYRYIQSYSGGTQVYFGTSGGAINTLTQSTLAYPGITWEKANKMNVGLQGSLLKNKLGFTVEYYNNKFYDLLITRGRSTGLLGINYPTENIGQNRYSGMDFNLSWQQVKNGFSYYISVNAGIQNSKLLFSDEVNQPYDYLRRTGQMVGRPFGYVATGLFQSDAEVASSPTFVGYKAQPGDIRYKDLNNDGVINQLDITAVGTDKPLTTYGVNLGASYKSFDINALIQGVANRNIFLTGNAFYEFQNGGLGQAYQQNLDRWTPTNPNATYPRLGIGNNSNNQIFSSFWTRSGDYVRLKSLEIGFTVPKRFTSRAKISGVRIFANGFNLLTSTKVKNIDPEVYNGSYPIQRLYNFGINIKL